MGNLIDIQSQIEKLQKQANEIKTKEFAKTVQEILAKMNAFGMTLKDLQPRKGRAHRRLRDTEHARGTAQGARIDDAQENHDTVKIVHAGVSYDAGDSRRHRPGDPELAVRATNVGRHVWR